MDGEKQVNGTIKDAIDNEHKHPYPLIIVPLGDRVRPITLGRTLIIVTTLVDSEENRTMRAVVQKVIISLVIPLLMMLECKKHRRTVQPEQRIT